jgi:hypothetical protein
MKRLMLLLLGLVATSTGQDSSTTKPTPAITIFREAVQYIHRISPSERNYVVSELAQAQAEAGFIPEAVATASLRNAYRDQLLVAIADIEARRGGYDSAMAIVAGSERQIRDQVRLEIGTEQARRGSSFRPQGCR